VATEAAWLKGKQFGKRRNKEKKENNKNERKALTLTGLLMEGVSGVSDISVIQHKLKRPTRRL